MGMYTTVLWRVGLEDRYVQFKTGDDACETYEIGATILDGEEIDGVFFGLYGNKPPFQTCTVIVRQGRIEGVVPGEVAVGGIWVPCDSPEKPPMLSDIPRSQHVPLWVDGRVAMGQFWMSVDEGWCVDEENVHPTHWLKVIPPA
jgi:hypothetical protein